VNQSTEFNIIGSASPVANNEIKLSGQILRTTTTAIVTTTVTATITVAATTTQPSFVLSSPILQRRRIDESVLTNIMSNDKSNRNIRSISRSLREFDK